MELHGRVQKEIRHNSIRFVETNSWVLVSEHGALEEARVAQELVDAKLLPSRLLQIVARVRVRVSFRGIWNSKREKIEVLHLYFLILFV